MLSPGPVRFGLRRRVRQAIDGSGERWQEPERAGVEDAAQGLVGR